MTHLLYLFIQPEEDIQTLLGLMVVKKCECEYNIKVWVYRVVPKDFMMNLYDMKREWAIQPAILYGTNAKIIY